MTDEEYCLKVTKWFQETYEAIDRAGGYAPIIIRIFPQS